MYVPKGNLRCAQVYRLTCQASAFCRNTELLDGTALVSHCSASTLSYEEVLVKSNSQDYDTPANLAIVVHGLLGTGRNWRTFARSLGKQAANESGR